MSLIEWDSSFSVGSERMDADHQRLLTLLNRLYDAWHGGEGVDELGWLFDELLAYADTHFAAEEMALKSRNYQRLEKQQTDHIRLKASVIDFRNRYLSGDTPTVLTEEMTQFLKDWLLQHILGEDMLYKDSFKGE
ncbi:hemerythrin [Paramagnetospirillum kuznetsovii]|uniref:Hemerythrin n=1 Tax=Paramagnetospirillum kuznetsovii TaxID=2053833 RepID=A0A364NW67_9PROT|nr:bacteriohemerythrin [Paramagnetospirillum kuznetsovii]RAU21293.1 hemerythrin [Paramagnetospirillum kuznetsovii]